MRKNLTLIIFCLACFAFVLGCSGLAMPAFNTKFPEEAEAKLYEDLEDGGFEAPYEILSVQKAGRNLFSADETWCVVFESADLDYYYGAIVTKTGYLWEAYPSVIWSLDEWVDEDMFLRLECNNIEKLDQTKE